MSIPVSPLFHDKPDMVADVSDNDPGDTFTAGTPNPYGYMVRVAVARYYGGMPWACADVKPDSLAAPLFAFTRNNKIRLGGYGYLLQGRMDQQVQVFLDTSKAAGLLLGGKWQGEFPPCGDVELELAIKKPKNAPKNWIEPIRGTAWADQVHYWLTSVEQATGVRPWIYTARPQFGYLLDSAGNPPSWTKDYLYWLKFYPDPIGYVDLNTSFPPSMLPTAVTLDMTVLWQWFEYGRAYGRPWNDLNTMTPAGKAIYDGASVPTPTPVPVPVPEPTPTPTPAPVPTPTPVPVTNTIKYARLRHVPRQMLITYDTVHFQNTPQGTAKGERIRLFDGWRKRLAGLQTVKAYETLLRPAAFYCNTPYEDGQDPLVERIGCGGNLVAYDSPIVTNHIRVRSFAHDEDPESIWGMDTFTYARHPELVHKATAIGSNGQVYNGGAGLDIYFYLLHTAGKDNPPDLFVDLSEVELFPDLPVQVTITAWTVALLIKTLPDLKAPVIAAWPQGRYYTGQSPTVLEYAPRGSNVWGRTDLGWICLQQNTTFYTTWRMSTQPPIPAVT